MAGKVTPSAQPPRKEYMEPAHVMDFDNLNLGHPPASKHTEGMLDLFVHVFGLDEIAGSNLPISIVILSHGWANKASQLDKMASGIIGDIARLDREGGRRKTKDVLVVTLDQRNHGQRRTNKDGLRFENNPKRLLHMATQLKGGKQDHQLIMELLPSFLFQHNERTVVDFMSVGISLGGHITWRLLREDPRITIGVPIISIPSECLGGYISRPNYNADALAPPAIAEYFFSESAPGVYAGKKILALHGGADRIMPAPMGAAWFPRIQAQGAQGEIVQVIQDGWGHIVTPEMVAHASEWVWRWGLSEAA